MIGGLIDSDGTRTAKMPRARGREASWPCALSFGVRVRVCGCGLLLAATVLGGATPELGAHKRLRTVSARRHHALAVLGRAKP